MTDDGGQKTEDRRQRTDDGLSFVALAKKEGQKTENRATVWKIRRFSDSNNPFDYSL
jgi:hypothetical protein